MVSQVYFNDSSMCSFCALFYLLHWFSMLSNSFKYFVEFGRASRYVKQYLTTFLFCNSPSMISKKMMPNDLSILVDELSVVFNGFAMLGVFDNINTILFWETCFSFTNAETRSSACLSNFWKSKVFWVFESNVQENYNFCYGALFKIYNSMDPGKVAIDHHPPDHDGARHSNQPVNAYATRISQTGGANFDRYPEATLHLQGGVEARRRPNCNRGWPYSWGGGRCRASNR